VDKNHDQSLIECLKRVGLMHKKRIPKAQTETKKSHGFETKNLCVYGGYVGYGYGKPPEVVIKEEENEGLSQTDKNKKDRGEEIPADGMKGIILVTEKENASTKEER
jgi:hypothetical protein